VLYLRSEDLSLESPDDFPPPTRAGSALEATM
jgi:hypothetical protein